MTAAHVHLVSTGRVADLTWHDRAVASGFRKTPVAGAVTLDILGFAGDAQGDTVNHGGRDKAVLAYPREHYAAWQPQLGDLAMPAFGENLTTVGLHESTVVVGAVYEVGTAVLQISQPRRPCYKIAAFHGVDDLAVTTQQTGRTGFYFRVLRPGAVCAGDEFTLIELPPHGLTVAEVHRVMNIDKHDRDGAQRLLASSGALPASWVRTLTRRLRGGTDDDSDRLGLADPTNSRPESDPIV